MKMQIYYFSGTGNSLHVACELQKRIPEARLVPMLGALKANELVTTGDIIGLVFPVHAFSVPFPVKEFLQRVKMQSASYIFAIATRGGSPCKVFTDINRIINKKGSKLAATFNLNMPNNYIPNFELPTEEEINRLEAEMQKKLANIQAVILNKQQYYESESGSPFLLLLFKQILFPILSSLFHLTRYFNMEKGFYADNKCNGCGICQKVCPAEKIAMKDGKPEWQNGVPCTFCFACLHYCPAKAVQIKKTTTPIKGRYHHPQVNATEIARQKEYVSL